MEQQRNCVTCGTAFVVPKPSYPRRFCSDPCWQIERNRLKPCIECGDALTTTRLCEPCRRQRRRDHYRHKNYQRRHATPPPSKKITLAELGVRDGWRCHLCRRRVNPALKSPHDLSPTMDHLEPIAEGGDHEPVNLALAHRICNTLRSNRGPAQLALIG